MKHKKWFTKSGTQPKRGRKPKIGQRPNRQTAKEREAAKKSAKYFFNLTAAPSMQP